MLGSGRTVISVPAYDLRNVDTPGSVFDVGELQRLSIPGDLRRAVQLVSAVCRKPLCMTRPEIFTCGAARRWLDDQLGTVRNHVCLSDGSAIKVIDGLANHVFLFRLDHRRNSEALGNLLSWAPELFAQIRSQINTFHGARLNGRPAQPPTALLLPKTRSSDAMPEFFQFFPSTHSTENSARLIMATGPVSEPNLQQFSEVTYVPFTECSAHDPSFSRVLAQKIAAAYFNPDQCILIRLPRPNENVAELLQQLTVALDAIRGPGIVMPRIPARNILLLRHDLPENFFDDPHDRLGMMFDSSFDFWRYTQALYRRLHGLTYVPNGDGHGLKTVVRGFSAILGRPPSGRRTTSAATPQLLQWIRGKTKAARHK
jgi:hypothetical protein